MHCRMFTSMPGPYSLHARSPLAVTKETIPRDCHMFSGHILSAVGNHCTSKTSQPEQQRGLKKKELLQKPPVRYIETPKETSFLCSVSRALF